MTRRPLREEITELVGVIRADLAASHRVYGTYLYVIHPDFVAVFLFRVAHVLAGRGPLARFAARVLSLFNMTVTGADFHSGAHIGPAFFIPHSQGTVIGEGVVAGTDLTIYSGVTLGQGATGFPQIGDHVTFFTKASAIGGVSIADGVRVGAHALVLSDVAAGATAVGVPARSLPPHAG